MCVAALERRAIDTPPSHPGLHCPHVPTCIHIALWITERKTCLRGKQWPLRQAVGIRDDDKVAEPRNTRYMTTHSSTSSFRRWRRTAAFKQKEIARLLGLKGPAQVSRIERGSRVPGLSLAIGLEVLTGAPLHEIVPPFYEQVEEETLARITMMLMEMEESTHPRSIAKCKHLRSCQARVITRHKNKMNAKI